MEHPAAQQILQSLVDGLDPLTRGQLPTDTVLQQAEVLRALLAGITALEADAVRSRRRAQLPQNVGRPWSGAEEQRLAAAYRAGEDPRQIAAAHHRTLAAIEARLERLGLISADERVTRNRYLSREDSAPVGIPKSARQR